MSARRPLAFLVAALLLLLVDSGCLSAEAPAAGPLPIDQVPMYGGLDRQAIPGLKKADEELIAGATKLFGSRAAASKAWVAQGLRYYQADENAKAMQRFNQAWLLDPNNPEVYWGFGSVLHDRGKAFDGYDMLRRAYDLGFRNPEFLADLGKLALVRIVERKDLSDAQKAAFEQESERYFNQAVASRRSLGYIYNIWASARYWQGDYAGAWQKVALARRNGAEVPPRFVELLSKHLPEPRG